MVLLRRLLRAGSSGSHSRLLPHLQSAVYSTDGDGSRLMVFDRDLKRSQRDRAAWLMRDKDEFVDTVAENILDRLEDCKRSFHTALCLGGSLGAVRRLLRGRGSIKKLIMMDISSDMIKKLEGREKDLPNDDLETVYVVGDEEFLPIEEKLDNQLSWTSLDK